MNLKSAARELGVHYQTAYRWVQSGELVAVRTGRSYEISESAIARFRAIRAAELERADRRVESRRGRETDSALIDRLAAAAAYAPADPMTLYRLAVSDIAHAIGDGAGVVLVDPDGAHRRMVALDHRDPIGLCVASDVTLNVPIPLATGFIGKAIVEERTIVVGHIPQTVARVIHAPRIRTYLDDVGIASIAVTPLRAGDRVVGAFGITRDHGSAPYSDAEVAALEDMAELLGHGVTAVIGARAGRSARDELKHRLDAGLAAHLSTPRAADRAEANGDDDLVACLVNSFELAPGSVPAALFTPDGRMAAVRCDAASFLGHRAVDLVGRHLLDLVPREHREQEELMFERLLVGDLDHLDHVAPRLASGGELRWIRVHRAAVRRPDQTPLAVVSTYTDATAPRSG